MKRAIALLFVCLVGVVAVSAQENSASMTTGKMNHETKVIRGADNPEAIPNDVAYHLVFIHLANLMNDSKSKTRAASLVSTIGLSPRDREVFVATLKEYKRKHDENVAKQPAEYTSQRNGIVHSTRDYLAAHMSTDGTAYLERYVRLEKAHMTVGVPAK